MTCYTFVRRLTLPSTVHAVTVPNDDGSFDIYINKNSPDEVQDHALEHEYQHIIQDHFYNEDPIWINEKEAG